MKQGRVLGTAKQVSPWDAAAAVATENRRKSSRKCFKTGNYAARVEHAAELLEDADAEGKRTIKPDARILSC